MNAVGWENFDGEVWFRLSVESDSGFEVVGDYDTRELAETGFDDYLSETSQAGKGLKYMITRLHGLGVDTGKE